MLCLLVVVFFSILKPKPSSKRFDRDAYAVVVFAPGEDGEDPSRNNRIFSRNSPLTAFAAVQHVAVAGGRITAAEWVEGAQQVRTFSTFKGSFGDIYAGPAPGAGAERRLHRAAHAQGQVNYMRCRAQPNASSCPAMQGYAPALAPSASGRHQARDVPRRRQRCGGAAATHSHVRAPCPYIITTNLH